MKRYLLPTVTCLMLPLAVFAADPASTNKSDYTLLNPVPDDQLRPLTSEVYDGVADERTGHAGHFQVESEAVNFFYNSTSHSNLASHEFLWEPRVTVGLLNNGDFYVRLQDDIL